MANFAEGGCLERGYAGAYCVQQVRDKCVEQPAQGVVDGQTWGGGGIALERRVMEAAEERNRFAHLVER